MTQFCKVFESKEYGQVLVKLDSNAENIPEVRFYFQPEDLGVCSIAISFTDDDEGWDRAEAAFTKVDEAFAMKKIEPMLLKLKGV